MTCIVIDTDDKASAADNAGFDVPASSDFLMECWVKQTATPSTWAIIGGKANHYQLQTDGSGNLWYRVYHSVDTNLGGSSAVTLTNDVWTHIAIVYDYSATTISFYAAGTRILTSGTSSGSITDNGAAEFAIGDTAGSCIMNTCHWFGSTDLQGYDPTSASITPPTAARTSDGNTIFQYKCDEGSGTTLDNAEGTAALDLSFAASANDPSWDGSDTPFTASNGALLLNQANNGGF